MIHFDVEWIFKTIGKLFFFMISKIFLRTRARIFYFAKRFYRHFSEQVSVLVCGLESCSSCSHWSLALTRIEQPWSCMERRRRRPRPLCSCGRPCSVLCRSWHCSWQPLSTWPDIDIGDSSSGKCCASSRCILGCLLRAEGLFAAVSLAYDIWHDDSETIPLKIKISIDIKF